MKSSIRTLAALVAVFLSVGNAPVLAASAGVLAITNARLETITRGTIESGTVVMEGGKITAIGPSPSLQVHA